MSWRHDGDELENRLVAAIGTTGFRFEVGEDRFLDFRRRSLQVRDDATWKLDPRLGLRVGGDVYLRSTDSRVRFPQPPQEGSGGILDNFSTAPINEIMEVIDHHTAAAYAAADIRPIRGTTITTGLRVDYYNRFSTTTISPRVSLEQVLSEAWTARASMGAYSRPPLQNEAFQTELEPERATQYVLGADYEISDGLKLQTSAFYTDRRQLIVTDPVLSAVDASRAYVNRGFGRSFGAEFLLRAKLDRFFGWVAYTVSRSDRIDNPRQRTPPIRLRPDPQHHRGGVAIRWADGSSAGAGNTPPATR